MTRFLVVTSLLIIAVAVLPLAHAQDGNPPQPSPESTPPAAEPEDDLPPEDVPAAPSDSYAVIVDANVRLRAAPSESATETLRLQKGDVVRVLGESGAFARVVPPGGLPVYVRKGQSGKSYVDEGVDGEGRVLVDNLLLRVTPSLDAANVGKLHTGDRLTILDVQGEWLKVLAPDVEAHFVPLSALKTGEDQQTLARDFAISAERRRAAIQRASDESRTERTRRQELKIWDEQFHALDARYQRGLKTPDDEVEWSQIRAAYQAFFAACPESSPVRPRAAERVVAAQAREDEARTLRATAGRIQALESEMAEKNAHYVRQLEEFRNQKAATPPPSPKRYVVYGLGNVRKDILSGFGDQPVYTLEKGGQRHYFLVSDRYDLDDYISMNIGIVEGVIEDPDNKGVRRLRVTRLDILE